MPVPTRVSRRGSIGFPTVAQAAVNAAAGLPGPAAFELPAEVRFAR